VIIRVKQGVQAGQITVYYQHMLNGVPVLGGRKRAASLPQPLAEKVLEHLKVIDNRFADAVLVNG
jgi:hypothetical protein